MTPSNRIPILTALVALLLVTGLAAQQKRNSAGASGAPGSNVPSEVASLRDDWVNHWNARELAPLLETYAPDAVLLPPDGQLVSGRDAISKYWRHAMEGDARTLSLHPVSGDSSGDFAYESGHLTYVAPGSVRSETGSSIDTQRGTTRHVTGSYLVVLRRGTGGKWRIVQHAFTEAFLKSMVEEKHPRAHPMMVPEER